MVEQAGRTFICSVVYVDLVEFSRKSNAEQVLVKETCNALAAEALLPIRPEDRIVIDTGDGFAITFLGDPEDALLVALKLRDAIEEAMSNHSIGVGRGTANGHIRIGVNLGPVKLGTGFNGRVNIVGDGINVAERIMGFALPGQLLVSRSFYEMVSRLADEYGRLLSFDGSRSDQNARVHALYAAGDAKAALLVAERRALSRRGGRPVDGTQTRIIAGSAPELPAAGAATVRPFAADSPPPHLARRADGTSPHWLQDRTKVGVVALALTACAAFQLYLLNQKWRTPNAPQIAASLPASISAPPAGPTATPVQAEPAPAATTPAPALPVTNIPSTNLPTPAVKPVVTPVVSAGGASAADKKVPARTPPPTVAAAPTSRPPAEAPPATATFRQEAGERRPEPLREEKPPTRRPPAGLQLPSPSVPTATLQATKPPPVTPAVEPTPAPINAGNAREPSRAAPVATSVVKRAGREPEFPKEAAREGLTRGSVRARVLIDASGNVTTVEILESRPSRVFDRSVRRALMDWKFNPGAAQRVYEAEIDFKRDN